MSKNYQKAAIRRIFALAVLIAGTCYIAATAWATTCFLPSGNCSTGRVGNEDKPNPDPDPNPNPNPPVDACKDFKNNSTKSEYDWKNATSCFICTTCTSNGNTKYNCVKNFGYSWDSSDGGHCCVSGEKWYSKMGMCCSSTSGCTCPTLKKWSNGECVCQYAKTSTGTCCEKDKIANKHLCCNAGEHAENTICCPANKHEEGGECKCDENYIPDGTGCKKKEPSCAYEYRQATTADSDNKTGNLDDGYKCTIGTKCYINLKNVTSLNLGGGTPTVNPINKISNESATCLDDKGITKYQTLCEGTPKSTCSDKGYKYEFKPNGCVSSGYNNGFEVKGDEWGDCVEKEEKCFYEYTMLTTKDTHGVTDISGSTLAYYQNYYQNGKQCDTIGSKKTITSTCFGYEGSNGTYRCGGISDGPECTNPGGSCKMERTCKQYYNCPLPKSCGIKDNPSVYSIYAGSHWDTPYNRISNASASCETLDGVTKYQTLCEGTPKSKCPSNKKFTPNKCVSSDYTNGIKVKGDEWGTCGCDTSNGYYDSIETCRTNANSGGCMASNIYGCYQTCASQGYFSTKEACLNSGTTNPGGSSYGSITLQGSCSKTDDCYKFNVNGFYIRNNAKSTVSCHDAQYSNFTTASISVYLLLQSNGKYATDINGKEVRDITQPGSQYPTNQEYYICGAVSNNNIPAHVRFKLDGQEFVGPDVNLNNSMYYVDNRGTCKKISFKNGAVHTVWWSIETRNMSDGKSYTCKLQ